MLLRNRWLNFPDRLDDLATATSLLTRFPITTAHHGDNLGESAWAWPVVGAIVGLLTGLIVWQLHNVGIGSSAAVVLGLMATILMTGCLHEDGLADTVDGFWGADNPKRRLEIMNDSGIGAFGACAIVLILMARFTATVQIMETLSPIAVLVASGAVSRAVMPVSLHVFPLARKDGLARLCGRTDLDVVSISAAIALFLTIMVLGWSSIVAIITAALAGFAVGVLSQRKIGGISGDTLGCTQQVSETIFLLTLVMIV
ncbi:MAG: adenosylcobinamide-GDP ribazoletransferase [Rhodobacteraceae bacterium]|nr:adenosylcobinamide-GDP ribazoletransferase [Paracoccaceae bacterium]